MFDASLNLHIGHYLLRSDWLDSLEFVWGWRLNSLGIIGLYL